MSMKERTQTMSMKKNGIEIKAHIVFLVADIPEKRFILEKNLLNGLFLKNFSSFAFSSKFL